MFEKKEKPTPTFSKRHELKFRSLKKDFICKSEGKYYFTFHQKISQNLCVELFTSSTLWSFHYFAFTDKNLTHKAQLRTKKKSQDGRKFQVKMEWPSFDFLQHCWSPLPRRSSNRRHIIMWKTRVFSSQTCLECLFDIFQWAFYPQIQQKPTGQRGSHRLP